MDLETANGLTFSISFAGKASFSNRFLAVNRISAFLSRELLFSCNSTCFDSAVLPRSAFSPDSCRKEIQPCSGLCSLQASPGAAQATKICGCDLTTSGVQRGRKCLLFCLIKNRGQVGIIILNLCLFYITDGYVQYISMYVCFCV